MKTHKDLDVWRKGIDLVTEIYETTKFFPKEELFGITSQIRKSAISIPSNIAEGAGRNHKKEFKQFLYISLGSLNELQTQLIICKNIGYLKEEAYKNFEIKLDDIGRMISGLIKYINRDS